jgi:hypothetical protein
MRALVEQEMIHDHWYLHLSSPLVFSGIRIAQYLAFGEMFWRSLIGILSFFFWPLCCLSFDLRLLSIPLVSSIFSWIWSIRKKKHAVLLFFNINQIFIACSIIVTFIFYLSICNNRTWKIKSSFILDVQRENKI